MPDNAARALRLFCLDCQGKHLPSVSACADTTCLLYPWRRKPPAAKGESGRSGCCIAAAPPATAKREADGVRENNAALAEAASLCNSPATVPGAGAPVRAIRRFCLVCAGSRAEVRACDAKGNCPLWSYRFGVRPATFKRVVARIKMRRMHLTLPGLSA